MANKSEERLDFVEQENLEMRTEMLPAMEENMSFISKSIENINVQMKKHQLQQQAILKYIEGIIWEKVVTTIETEGSLSVVMGINSATEMMMAEPKTDGRNDDDKTFDRSKFKKVEMPIFNKMDLDFWLFRADQDVDKVLNDQGWNVGGKILNDQTGNHGRGILK
ncbi:transposon Tf2-1 polyprotein isoform X1 [Cucumis melo var. makuwa]|uniref:Transposon Tf2-1 polyprotein isoform X1 n=1 Tax=Cucumis melo var. makuwa TaxID=1194695 RepID=A0A5A7TRA3_CUCMM|nr:transposon Tf2-1 polyprotein isoform X1 [Cucumis melo var. makuwa]